ncbi:MAG TPA: CHY zinc finger protein [Virgibacillus sp.]|nr:CHY zinc finger protein [Virgibacillus sp.]
MDIHGIYVKGAIDRETRCHHYQTEKDRIAIKFYCCKQFFPCYQCHADYGCGKRAVWPRDQFHMKAVLCGTCGYTLTVTQYLMSGDKCPSCQSPFNPGCSRHTSLYFATS